MKQIKISGYVIENGKKQKTFESYDPESIINWTITGLYDGCLKRAKVKLSQYYDESKEYCKIEITYNREYTKDLIVIENWSNDWGNFINVYDTFKNNKIKIITE